MTCRVGILGFQGCIEPHEDAFRTLGIETHRVTQPQHLEKVDRLILPGGESSTMLRFLKLSDMIGPLKAFATSQPIWGICAGAILLASTVRNPEQEALGIMPIEAHRNFYGSQLQSFTTTLRIDFLATPIEAQFIRAPLLVPATQESAHSLGIHAVSEGHPVFFSFRSAWATSFHSELRPPYPLHEAFLAR
jgi:pyridoxal 5'-phosphate synthase pdxT subunit